MKLNENRYVPFHQNFIHLEEQEQVFKIVEDIGIIVAVDHRVINWIDGKHKRTPTYDKMLER